MARGRSTLTVELKAVVGQYQSAMRQAGGATDSVEQGLKRVEKAGAGLAPVSVHIRRVGLSAESADAGTKKLGGGIDRLHKGATGLESGMSGVADGIAGVTTIMEEGASASAGTALAFANIGSAASNAAVPITKGLSRGLSGLKSLSKGVGAALSGDILGGLAKIAKGASGATTGIGGLANKLGGMKNLLIGGGVVAGVGALVIGLKELEQAAEERNFKQFVEDLQFGQGAIQDSSARILLLEDSVGKAGEVLRQVAEEGGPRAAAMFVDLAAKSSVPAPVMAALRSELQRINEQFGVTAPLDNWARAVERQTEALKGQQDALAAMADPVFAAISASREAADAVARQTEAKQRLTEAELEFGVGSAEAMAAQRELDAAQQGVAESALRQFSTQQTLAQGLANGTVKVETLEGTLADLEAQGYGASGMAQWLRQKIAELRSKDLYLRAYDLTTDAVNTVRRNLNSLHDKTINIRTVVSYSVPSGQTFGGGQAAGGPVRAGKWYVVGERGPEIFMPDQSGTIIPNSSLYGPMTSAGWTGGSYGAMGMAGGRGGAVVNINVGPGAIVANDPKAVAEGLIRYVRRDGAGQLQRALGIR